jgi:hypothetical protein
VFVGVIVFVGVTVCVGVFFTNSVAITYVPVFSSYFVGTTYCDGLCPAVELVVALVKASLICFLIVGENIEPAG